MLLLLFLSYVLSLFLPFSLLRAAPVIRTRFVLVKDRTADIQYSQAVRAGDYVYTSGSVGMTKEGQMVEGTVSPPTFSSAIFQLPALPFSPTS